MYGICVLKKKIFFQKSKAWVTTYKINGKIKWKIEITILEGHLTADFADLESHLTNFKTMKL